MLCFVHLQIHCDCLLEISELAVTVFHGEAELSSHDLLIILVTLKVDLKKASQFMSWQLR